MKGETLKYLLLVCLFTLELFMAACAEEGADGGSGGDPDAEDVEDAPEGDGDSSDVEPETGLDMCTPFDDGLCFATDHADFPGPFHYVEHGILPSGCSTGLDSYTVQMYESVTSQTGLLVQVNEYSGPDTFVQSSHDIYIRWSVDEDAVTTNYQSLNCRITVNPDGLSGRFEDCHIENMENPDIDFHMVGAWSCSGLSR